MLKAEVSFAGEVRHVKKGTWASFTVTINYLPQCRLYTYCQPERFARTSISSAGTKVITGINTK
jgi:hypothetical protein